MKTNKLPMLKKLAVVVACAFAAYRQERGLAMPALALALDKAEWAKLAKDVQAMYVEKDGKYALDLPEGVEEVKGLKSALEKERAAAKTSGDLLKETLKRFEGIDPEEVRKILDKLGSDEERQLMKDGKIDEVVARRMQRVTAAHEKAIKAAAEQTAAAAARADKFASQVLDNHVRQAATKAGLHPNAVDDALFRARTIFKLDENGEARQLDTDGKPVLGKNGKDPYAPTEWLEGMKETAPHWFPAGGSGGGATGGNKTGAGGAKSIKRAEFDGLNPADKSTKMKEGFVVVD